MIRRIARLDGASRHVMLAAALFYVVLSLTMVGPALIPGHALSNADSSWFAPPWAASRPHGLTSPSNFELGDTPQYYYPVWQYAKAQLPHVPLWDPYLMAGRPFLANDQSDIFSPFSVPAYLMSFWRSLAWMVALKLWVAAFGTFLLARSLGLRFGGALFAGLVYGFNFWLVVHVTWPAASVWALAPWLLFATEHLVRRPDAVSAGGLSVVVCLQFLSGHAESSAHALLLTLLFFIMRLLLARQRDGPVDHLVKHRALAFTGAMIVGTTLAAVVLAPFLELLLQSADTSRRANVISHDYLGIKNSLEWFFAGFWGFKNGPSIVPFIQGRAIYAGALPLMLTGAALLSIRRSAERRYIAIYASVALAVTLGIRPIPTIISHLPLFNVVHNEYVVIYFILCLGLLSGWGLDDLAARSLTPALRRSVLIVGAALLVVPVLAAVASGEMSTFPLGRALNVAWGFATPPSPNPVLDPNAFDVTRLASVLIWITVAAVGLLLVTLRLGRRLGPSAFIVAAVLLVAGDLFRTGMGYNPSIREAYARQPATPAIRYLEAQRPARFVSVADVPEDVIPLGFRLYEARGYDYPLMARYDRLWLTQVSPEYRPGDNQSLLVQLPVVTARALRALRLLSVSDILQSNGDPPVKLPGVRLAYRGSDALVYHIDGSLPRAFLVTSQETVRDGNAALAAVTAPSFNAMTTAVTEQHLPGLPDAPADAPARVADARIVTYAPEEITVSAKADRTSVLVLTDNYYRGWQATVDGKPAPVERVDYIYRGVRVGPGTHTIEFRYQPASWRIGWIVSVVSVVWVGVMLTVGIARRRRQGQHRGF